jgi:RNA polymerase sigma-70 factor (ECF subfamily)
MTAQHERLIEDIANRDEDALVRFYRSLGGTVYSFAHARLRSSQDASEILNEVMLEVWHSASRYEGRSTVRTWVLGITHHKILDRLRKRQRDALNCDEQKEIADDAAGPAELMAAAENRDWVWHCLEQLSDSHRQVVYLAFFEELPYSEIATVLQCPEGTVKTRMYHAKQHFKRCLSKKI